MKVTIEGVTFEDITVDESWQLIEKLRVKVQRESPKKEVPAPSSPINPSPKKMRGGPSKHNWQELAEAFVKEGFNAKRHGDFARFLKSRNISQGNQGSLSRAINDLPPMKEPSAIIPPAVDEPIQKKLIEKGQKKLWRCAIDGDLRLTTHEATVHTKQGHAHALEPLREDQP